MNIKRLNYKVFIYTVLLLLVDIIVLIATLNLSIFIRKFCCIDELPIFYADSIDKYYWILAIVIFVFILEKIYFIRYDFWTETKRIYKALLFSFVAVFTVISLSKISNEYSRIFILLFFSLSFLFVPFFKRRIKKILFSFSIFKINVKIIAKEPQYGILEKELKENWYFGYKLVEKDYDIVLISSKRFTIDELQKIIKDYSKNTKDIYVIPYMDHLDFTHTDIVEYSNIRLSALHIENRLLNLKNIVLKSFFEKVIVLLILPFALILHILISILIWIDSSGSIIFKQKRLGKDSKKFSCYKYRTMYINNDILLKKYLEDNPEEVEYYNIYHKYKNDPRITKIGNFLRKTSLDEFPQFFNILRGDMNLIGPRPYMLEEKVKIGKLNEDIILKVKPGITGLWQVSGRNELTFKQRVELDTWYIQNWSLWMDFVIFIKTIKVVVYKVGAK
jgi:undecaprenyl-phosphate galactose phosphotransferase